MEKFISLQNIMFGTWFLGIAHIFLRTGDYHPYIAAGIVLFGLLRVEDALKKPLTS